jgi:hypothetical protein
MKYIGKASAKYDSCRFSFSNHSNEKYSYFEKEKYIHYGLFYRVINHLKKEGFDTGKDLSVDKLIRKDYYRGIKNGLEFRAHRYPSGFSFEFFQNVTKSDNSNGGEYDFDKYRKFTYVLKLTLQNELKKLCLFLEGLGVECNYDIPLKTSEENIIKHHNNAHWLKFSPKSLDDIQSAMRDHDATGRNSLDANKNLISCGDIKYFYSGRKLQRGRAYYNINNMWWIVTNDTEYTNIASFNLFDYEKGMEFKKKFTPEQQLNRLSQELKKYSNLHAFERCIKIRNEILKLSTEPTYRVWSIKHGCWWAPNNCGYTKDKSKAGIYLESNIKQDYHNNGVDSKIIPVN